MQRAGGFDSKTISEFARQFDHVAHAKSFVRTVIKLTRTERTMLCKPAQCESLREILKEIQRGDYDCFDVRGKTVLDIGAYLGETAILFSRRGAKKVYAVEPFSSHQFIGQNARRCGCDNVIPIKAALGKKDERVFVAPDFVNDGGARLAEHTFTLGVPLMVFSLDSLVASMSPNGDRLVLKLDAEGAEDALFFASKATLQRFDSMMVEAHESIHKDIGLELAMFLTQNGFKTKLESHGENVGMIYAENAAP